MAIKKFCEKIILIILTVSILLSFIATPVSNAGLSLKDGEFYYSGTTKGTYVVSEGIFSWLIDNLGKIADWIFGICTMGVRMVFVGWTALIEKLLTWSVESAGGVSNNGGLVVDSTDVTAIGDSSGNLTVEAIVYNRVPLFDINFFNLEIDKTVSPTGQKLRCEKCKKPVEECCQITEGNVPDKVNCDCDCNACSNCEQYLLNWQAEDPLVIKIREFIAMWYTIIRLLALAAMLIVLIGIGIKMALSTIASEKAVYKRMFIDWIVGIIILFAIHYLIYFVIIINETLVETVRETANSINKTQLQFVNFGNKTKDKETNEDIQVVNDDEIEISIYEEIRTRAYDAKLSVGLSGMIMYMTLVYFAIRYSISYLKRYLTVIVLSLIAPPLGVAYALQKALTGKSSSFKKWMTEFVMTVIIQIVHALIYAVFISTALALSMESVAGMIVALIFMNFALKAEKMFRQIFKMGESDSLAGSVAEAGDAENIHSKVKAATGLVMSAKPIAGAMMNTPMVKGIKVAGKVGLAGGMAAGNALVGAIRGKSNNESTESTESTSQNTSDREQASDQASSNAGDLEIPALQEGTNSSGSQSMAQEKEEQALMAEGGDTLRTKFAQGVETLKDPKATPAQKAQAREDMNNYVRYQMMMNPAGKDKKKKALDSEATSSEIAGAHFKKAVNIKNHFEISATDGGSFSQGFKAIFGTSHRDPHTGKQVYDGNGYFSRFNSSNLFGLSDEDKKFIKEEGLVPLKAAFAGSIGLMVGLGTFVANPGLGAVGIGYGASKYNKLYKQIKGPAKYKGTYGKARFPAQTVQNAHKQLLKNAYNELEAAQVSLDRGMIDKVKVDRPELYNAIMKDLKNGDSYSGLNIRGNVSYRQYSKSTGGSVSTAVPKKWSRMPEIFDSTGSTANMGVVDRYALKRAQKETAKFEKDGANLLKVAHEQEWKAIEVKQKKKMTEDSELVAQAYIQELSHDKFDNESKEDYDARKTKLNEFIANCKELGYSVDTTKNQLKKNKTTISKEMFNSTYANESEKIESTIDEIIQDMYRVSGKVDVSTEAGMNSAIKALSSRLKSNGLLTNKKQDVEILFKDKETMKKVLKDKANIFNSQSSISSSNLSSEQSKMDKLNEIISGQNGFNKKEQELIQQIVLENGLHGLDSKDIMDRVSTQIGMQNQGKKQPVNNKSRAKGIHKTNKQESEERKDKIKAISEFLKVAETINPPEASITDVSKKVMENTTITDLQNERIKKRIEKNASSKIKTVLQFMNESGDATIAELIDSTDEKVKNARQGMEVDGKVFNKTEAETLELLFNKMKEEVIFNEYTKNVLDQKDGSKTIAAKKKLYEENTKYLSAQRQLLEMQNSSDAATTIASKHKDFGVENTGVTNVLNGNISISELAKDSITSLSTEQLKGILDSKMKKDAKDLIGGDVTSDSLDTFLKDNANVSKAQSRVIEYLNKQLQNDVPDVEKARRNAQRARKEASLTGKIDIYSQLSKL